MIKLIIKLIITILITLIIIDLFFSLLRNYRRSYYYNKCLDLSKATGKKLLVIGDPSAGFWNKNIKQAYGCGDICIDLLGCKCPIQIKGDVLNELKKMKTNSYIIYESCVLEYIDDKYISEIKKEIKRVSGGHYYCVRVYPNIFPVNFSFIETGNV
jgi:hypothetical protein